MITQDPRDPRCYPHRNYRKDLPRPGTHASLLRTEHAAEKGNTGMELIRHLYQQLPIFGLIVL
jgi:hypothetical protein